MRVKQDSCGNDVPAAAGAHENILKVTADPDFEPIRRAWYWLARASWTETLMQFWTVQLVDTPTKRLASAKIRQTAISNGDGDGVRVVNKPLPNPNAGGQSSHPKCAKQINPSKAKSSNK